MGRRGRPGAREPPSGGRAARGGGGGRSRAAPGRAGQPEPVWRRGCHTRAPRAPPGGRAGLSRPLTRVMSREAAAALMCRLGCRTELLQSRARAKVPTELGGGGRGGGETLTPEQTSRPAGLSATGSSAQARPYRGGALCSGVRGLSLSLSLYRALLTKQPSDSSAGWRLAGGWHVALSAHQSCPSGARASASAEAAPESATALCPGGLGLGHVRPSGFRPVPELDGHPVPPHSLRKEPHRRPAYSACWGGGPEQPLRASSVCRNGQASLGTRNGSPQSRPSPSDLVCPSPGDAPQHRRPRTHHRVGEQLRPC